VPDLEVTQDVRVQGEHLCFGRSIHLPPAAPAAPPDQLYLFEFADLDLADIEAVAAFCRKHGRIAPQWLDEDLPKTDLQSRIGELAQHSSGKFGRRFQSNDERFFGTTVHIDEFTYRVRIVRQLSRHVQAHVRHQDVAAVWPDCPDADEAWRRFAVFTNAALSPFRVRVDLGPWTPSLPEAALYSVAVLQMVNDLSEHLDFKVCAAEKCGRTFVRQRGRSSNYSRSTGVLYCSDTCANSQAQREWRRRQRAKKVQGST
jgi:hypothetical protein